MPYERVLAEMRAAGLEATELGPPDYLPADLAAMTALLDRHGLRLAAGFLALVLHEPREIRRSLDAIGRQAQRLAMAGADVLVLAAALPGTGYDRRSRLTRAAWQVLFATLERAAELTAGEGIGLAVHPHFGTAVETGPEVARLLDATSVSLCLDTGHLYLGGVDPAHFVAAVGSRINHVHLKDVDARLAAKVRSGKLAYAAAVRAGLYRPLRSGDLPIARVVAQLEKGGYDGWYVLEQDVALRAEPPPSNGPVVGVAQSVAYFRSLLGAGDATALQT
jgi:inosose dehydratase